MRNWIILAILVALAYYLYTKSDGVDKPMDSAQTFVESTQDKLDKATDAQMDTLEAKVQSLKATIDAKLSGTEKQAFDLLAQSKEKMKQFVDEYCAPSAPQSSSFSKDSQDYICKELQN
ncbi:apolipoprotein A1/A4/E family protein [Shewanella surugensis]|uniref:Apolipoprotein A1/A4/E family protein n=1 Tax=Shewanella surugensis TaxID=212020 RepID=A0ABT0LBI8_9GAMM|nr:apolipoprotein A1/A4/E family protein [Shewanella surugensis]MCL1125074.1 apolipoprotein A1/A4/E family protein [Shewanella surugensis]